MSDDLTRDRGALCLSCGLCCDGSLFGRVPLSESEQPSARRHGLRVIPSGRSFEQPCAALVRGACAIYEERPHACRAFTCALLARSEPLATRLAAVVRTKALLASLETLDGAALAELRERMDRDFARV